MADLTQSDRLPAEIDKELRLLKVLKNRSDFTIWDFMLKRTLKQYDLDDLINYNINRPIPRHPKY